MKVFCIGNGESRKGFDLNKLKPFGKIYGCNALYREFSPDVLVSVDHGIMHEIYHSGYSINNNCIFRDWTKIPDLHYQTLVYEGMSEDDINRITKWDMIKQNDKPKGSCEFVMHGAKLEGVAKIVDGYKNDEMIIKEKYVNQTQLYVSWLHTKDKVACITDVLGFDYGYSAGTTSLYVSAVIDKPKEIYLIGHDLNTTTGNLNNIYKDTKHYMASYNKQTDFEKWINQLKTIFTNNPDIQFYKVNNSLNPLNNDDKVNIIWEEFNGFKNLHYITYEALDKRLQL